MDMYMQLRHGRTDGNEHVAWAWSCSMKMDIHHRHGTLVHSIDIDVNIRHGDGREHGGRHEHGDRHERGHTLLLDRPIKSSLYSNFFSDREIG